VLEACSTLPTLAIEIVFDKVWNEFYVREPRVTLQWILGWITAGRYMWNADIHIKACPAASSDQTTKIDLLFEKNSLNSYQEKEMIAQAALKTFKNLKTQMMATGSDVIDEVFRSGLEELQTTIQENIVPIFLTYF
jgi:hypothetical protein